MNEKELKENKELRGILNQFANILIKKAKYWDDCCDVTTKKHKDGFIEITRPPEGYDNPGKVAGEIKDAIRSLHKIDREIAFEEINKILEQSEEKIEKENNGIYKGPEAKTVKACNILNSFRQDVEKEDASKS